MSVLDDIKNLFSRGKNAISNIGRSVMPDINKVKNPNTNLIKAENVATSKPVQLISNIGQGFIPGATTFKHAVNNLANNYYMKPVADQAAKNDYAQQQNILAKMRATKDPATKIRLQKILNMPSTESMVTNEWNQNMATPKQIAAGAGQDLATYLLMRGGSKVMAPAEKFVNPVAKGATRVGINGVIGAGYGATSKLSEDPNATTKDVMKSAGSGFLFGSALGLGGEALNGFMGKGTKLQKPNGQYDVNKMGFAESNPTGAGNVGRVERLGKDEVILYHRTTPENAAEIMRTGKFISKENTGEIFLSNKKAGQNTGYGDAVVPVRVKKSSLRLDDEFPSGEKHYAVESSKVIPSTPNIGAEIKPPITIDQIKPPVINNQTNPATTNITPKSGIDKIGNDNVQSSDNFVSGMKEKFNNLYTQAIDRFHPLHTIGAKAGKEQEVLNAIAGHYGAGTTAQYHTDFELAPILKNTNIDDLRSFVIAQRDAELAGRGIKGSSSTEAQKIIADLSQKYGGDLSQLDNSAKQLYAYQDNLVKKYLVDTGVLSKEQYNAMKATNQKYVPFQRVMDKVDEHLGIVPEKSAGSVSGQNVIKGIKGSERQIQDPLESIIANTYKTVSLGKRQEVAKTLVSLEKDLPKGIIRKVNGKIGNTPTISLFENGKVTHYAVPPEVSEAAKGMNQDQMSTIVKILAAPTRVFRETATGINPEFGPKNVLRDVQSAFVNAGANPLKWVSGLAHYIKKDQVYQDFLKSGGLTSRASLDRPVLKKTVQELSSKNGISVTRPGDLYKLLQKFSEASEQPTRINVFEQTRAKLLQQGLPIEEATARAAQQAQDATVNFARRGSKTQSINSIYAFLNARAQGVDQLIRTARKDPAGFAFRAGLISQAPALALYAYNRQFPNYYDERVVSKYDKKNNFIIMAPFLGKDRFIKIPKGEIGSLANPTEEFLSYVDGHGSKMSEALGSSLQAFSPVNNMGDLIPTALRPAVENTVNKNFYTGYDIVPDYKSNYPAGKQDNPSTAPIYRALGQNINVSPAKLQNATQGYLTGMARIGENIASPFISDKYKTIKNESGDPINRIPIIRNVVGGAKQTEQQAAESNIRKDNSNQFKIMDLKSGLRKGDITPEEYDKQIQKITGQSNTTQNSSSDITQFGDGSYAYKSGTGWKFKDTFEEAKIAHNNDQFAKSNKNFQIIDGIVYRKDKNGKPITPITEEEYNSKLFDAQLTAYKNTDDYSSWKDTANKLYNTYINKLNDPNTDDLDKLDIQNKIASLAKQYSTYKSYGGKFKKGKAAKKGKKPNFGKLPTLSNTKTPSFRTFSTPKKISINHFKVARRSYARR